MADGTEEEENDPIKFTFCTRRDDTIQPSNSTSFSVVAIVTPHRSMTYYGARLWGNP